jgi:hypothetical protein
VNVFEYIQGYTGGRSWKYIIIHHSLTKDGKVNDWQAIKAWHTGKAGSPDPKSPDFNPYIAKPDQDIGYHFGLEYVGGILTPQIGRSLNTTGAHCVGKNTDGIGICVVGNYDLSSPGHDQLFMLASICRELMKKFGIGAFRILPHRDFAPKTCPGKYFSMETLKNYISPGAI